MNIHTLTATTLLVGTCSTFAQAPVPWRQFDAALDAAGDATWSNTSPLNNGAAQDFNFASPATAVDVNDPFAVGLTKAYDFSVTGAANGSNWSFWGQAGGNPPRANHAETTFEVFFSASNLDGTHAIMEIGGAAAGVSMVLDGDSLIWAANPGGPNTDDTHSIATSIGTGWHHAVATWNRLTLETSLYLDGQLVGTVALDPDTTGWTGGNEGALGGLPNTSIAATVDPMALTDFDGSIAAFNYYREELTAQQVADNFNAVFIPAPASAAIVAAGGLVATRRHR